MKLSGFVLILLFLLGCSRSDESSRLVEFVSPGGVIHGRGVILSSDSLLTVKHVYDSCQRSSCTLSTAYGETRSLEVVDTRGDAIILTSDLEFPHERAILAPGEMLSGTTVYLGSLGGKIGNLIAESESYIGYDAALSGTLLMSVAKLDLTLEKGESGTPLWTESSELVGVVSTVDPILGGVWIVR